MQTPILSDTQVSDELAAQLPRWTLEAGEGGGAICRTVCSSGWKATLMVVNTIGHLTEAAWHHPSLQVGDASMLIRLNTHDAGGITAKDITLARQIEVVPMWRAGAEPGAVLDGASQTGADRCILYD